MQLTKKKKKKNTGRISLKQLLESYEQEKKISSIAINETTNPPSILTLSIHQKIKIMILIKLFFRPANGKCPLIQIRLNKLIYLIIYHWDIYGYILMKRLHSNIILIKKIIKPIRTLKLFVNSIIFSSLHFISNLPFLL